MGKLTKEMVDTINERYKELRSYIDVADELNIDPRTVKKHIKEESNKPNYINSKKTDGVIAALAFELFEKGMKPIPVVIELKQPPEVVKKLYKEWLEIKQQLVIPSQIKKQIYSNLNIVLKIIHDNFRYTDDADGLLKAMSAIVEDRLEFRNICYGCGNLNYLNSKIDEDAIAYITNSGELVMLSHPHCIHKVYDRLEEILNQYLKKNS
jgi:hypothetical protein